MYMFLLYPRSSIGVMILAKLQLSKNIQELAAKSAKLVFAMHCDNHPSHMRNYFMNLCF